MGWLRSSEFRCCSPDRRHDSVGHGDGSAAGAYLLLRWQMHKLVGVNLDYQLHHYPQFLPPEDQPDKDPDAAPRAVLSEERREGDKRDERRGKRRKMERGKKIEKDFGLE